MKNSELRAKMAKIEALFAGTSFQGERDAAGLALERMLSKLQEEKKHYENGHYWLRKNGAIAS